MKQYSGNMPPDLSFQWSCLLFPLRPNPLVYWIFYCLSYCSGQSTAGLVVSSRCGTGNKQTPPAFELQ